MSTLLKGTPWWIHLTMTVSVLLVVGSFLVPPTGVVDGSVLAAVGELMGGTTLITFVTNIPAYLEAGVQARITRGSTEITLSRDDEK